MSGIVLYDYWRSSAAYRVRIALGLKGAEYRTVSVDLSRGEQGDAAFGARNPLHLVPVLEIGEVRLAQSLAIIDYLDALFPQPALLPADPPARAQVLARAMTIISEIHPLQNLRVANYLRDEMGQDAAALARWWQHWIGLGLAALEAQAPQSGLFGGDTPDLVDVCLVPQMYSARRFSVPLDGLPNLVRIDAALREIPQVVAASPEAARPE